MSFVKRCLTFIRGLNLTAISKLFLSSQSWVTRFFASIFFKKVEVQVDRGLGQIEDTIDAKVEDQVIEQTAQAKVEQIMKAETDEELDEAFRDSLR